MGERAGGPEQSEGIRKKKESIQQDENVPLQSVCDCDKPASLNSRQALFLNARGGQSTNTRRNLKATANKQWLREGGEEDTRAHRHTKNAH